MRPSRVVANRVGFAALVLCMVLFGARTNAAEWEWSFVPYLWASDISLDVVSGDRSAEVEIGFRDLLDKVDLALQGHFEGRKGRAGFFLDLTYIDAGKNAAYGESLRSSRTSTSSSSRPAGSSGRRGRSTASTCSTACASST